MTERAKKALVFYPHNFFEMSAGTHRRVYDLLRYLKKRGFTIDLLSLDGFTNRWGEKEKQSKELFDSVRVCEWKLPPVQRLGYSVFKKLDRTLQVLPDCAIASLKKAFKEMVDSGGYGYVVISYVYWASLAGLAGKGVVKVIDLHDFITLNTYLLSGKKEFTLGKMFEGEVRAISRFDYALSISQEETLMLGPFCPGTRMVDVPVSFPRRALAQSGHDFDILFIGSDNSFNVKGMEWFMGEVYPLLPRRVRVAVVGRVCGHIEKKDNITLIPHVSDVDEVYTRAKLSFCPLKGGTGLKVKVVEALSYGMPVVTTSWGLTGMLQKEGNGCLVAESAEDFAKGVLLLLDNEDAYRELRKKAEDFFSLHYSVDAWESRLDGVFLAR